MVTDPTIDFFERIQERKERRKPKPEERTYPGTTPPRNDPSTVVDSGQFLWLNELPSREFSVKGEVRKFYTIGTLAKALGKSQVTLRSWEDKGWLPKAAYRSPVPVREQLPGKKVVGQRLYTKDQLVFLVMVYNQYIEIAEPNWPAFREAIKRQYPRQ